jgi:hypothetical protein
VSTGSKVPLRRVAVGGLAGGSCGPSTY